MRKLIAIAGKGGTGKTTLSALLVRILARESASLLAIDADPNNNLWQWLGLKRAGTVMDIVEDLSKNKDTMPHGMTKQNFIDLKVQESIEECDRFDLLSMGRPEGPGCYCYANNLLRGLIEKISKSYEIVIIDNEAGMEHLSRRLLLEIDLLFIISDFSVVGIRSAKNISSMPEKLGIKIKEKMFILNKATENIERLRGEIERLGIEFAGFIPYDRNLDDINIKGGSIFDMDENSQTFKAIERIAHGFTERKVVK